MAGIDKGERMQVSIEEAKPSEIEAIQRVYYKTWLATYPNEDVGVTVDDIEDRFKDRFSASELEKRRKEMEMQPTNEKQFVAKVGETIVGVCYVKKLPDKNRLQTIYVLPRYQGKGIGRALWKAAAQFFDSSKDTYVYVTDYNKNAIDFYTRLGFVDTGKRNTDPRFKMKSGVDLVAMEMCLKAS